MTSSWIGHEDTKDRARAFLINKVRTSRSHGKKCRHCQRRDRNLPRYVGTHTCVVI